MIWLFISFIILQNAYAVNLLAADAESSEVAPCFRNEYNSPEWILCNAFDVAPQPLGDNAPRPKMPINEQTGQKYKVLACTLIDTLGEVKAIEFNSDSSLIDFQSEVEKVLPFWKFVPAKLNGRPLEAWIKIPFNFIPNNGNENGDFLSPTTP